MRDSPNDSPAPHLSGSPGDGVFRPPEVFDGVIGIDLGTTYSCVAVYINSAVQIIPNDMGMRTTPSRIALEPFAFPGAETECTQELFSTDPDAHIIVGDAALNASARGDRNVIYDSKRMIGRRFGDTEIQSCIPTWPFTVRPKGSEALPRGISYDLAKFKDAGVTVTAEVRPPGGGEPIVRDFEPEEISAIILGYLRRCAERFLARPVQKAVISVPAHFNDAQRERTRAAGTVAGLSVLRIINEPTAASLAYGIGAPAAARPPGEEGSAPQRVLVFDFGGGTFDISIIAVDDGVHEVLATAGDSHLGGQDLDNNLLTHILAEIKRQFKTDFSSTPRAVARLRLACERVKRVLTSKTSETLYLDEFFPSSADGDEFQRELTISRAKFEQLNDSLFRHCMRIVSDALTYAHLASADIDRVVLVGGSSRIPKVQKLLSDFFDVPGAPSKLCHAVNPDEAVAVGAAIQGAVLSSLPEQQSEAVKKLLIIDVVSLSIGVEIDEGTFDVLVPRNSPIPRKVEKEFTTSHDYQTDVDINVYEGESALVENNHRLAFFKLEGLSRARRGRIDIVVTFSIDENSLLTVTAEEKTKKKKGPRKSLVVNSADRLHPEEIKQMIARAAGSKESDERKASVLKAVVKIRNTARDLIGALAEHGKKGANNEKVLINTEEIKQLVIPLGFPEKVKKRIRDLERPLQWLFSTKPTDAPSLETIQSKLIKLAKIIDETEQKIKKYALKRRRQRESEEEVSDSD